MRTIRIARTMGLAGIIAGASLTATVTLGACGGPDKPPATLSASDSWCPDGFEVGPQDTCFAVPEKTTKDTPVLVYLHGMYIGHGSPDEWNLVHSAVTRGFAVVMPRGKRGLCAWKAELKDHFCWPQETDDPQAFKNVVAEWDRVLWQVDAILEAGTHKRYVLGYSNGGFFASYIAEHALFPAQAYSIVNGGMLEPVPRVAKPMPIMLISAADDMVQGPKMKELNDSFSKASWMHAFCTRPGQHPLAQEDVQASLRFFQHDHDGNLAVQSSAYACEGGTTTAPGGAGPDAPAASPPPGSPAKKDKPGKGEKSDKP
jgi:poly(3-hydroxybutyrate) depolymerase